MPTRLPWTRTRLLLSLFMRILLRSRSCCSGVSRSASCFICSLQMESTSEYMLPGCVFLLQHQLCRCYLMHDKVNKHLGPRGAASSPAAAVLSDASAFFFFFFVPPAALLLTAAKGALLQHQIACFTLLGVLTQTTDRRKPHD